MSGWRGLFYSIVCIAAALGSGAVGFCADEKLKRLVVAADGSGTHRTIQSAIEAADDGAVIEVRAGRYIGPVKIAKKVELRGAGWGEVVLTTEVVARAEEINEMMKEHFGPRGPGKEDRAEVEEVLAGFGFPLLKVTGEGVAVSGIKVVNGMMGDKNRIMGVALVEFDRAKAELRDCAVLGGPGNGITVRNGSTVTVTNCLVAAQWGTGIAIGGGDDLVNRATIVDSEIRNCYHRCITIRSEREVRVERCRISGSAWHGIRYDDCSPVVEGCLIAESARSGIYASGKTAATVRSNVFWRNGFSAWFANRDVIEGNTFVENSGINIIGRTAPTIRGNLFEKNQIAIAQSLTEGVRPEDVLGLEEITIEKNAFVGNKGIWRAHDDKEATISLVRDSILDEKNFDATSGVVDLGKTFGLAEDFREKYPGIGSTATFVGKSAWPLQPEEEAIIPEEAGTRDWRLWRN